METVRIEFEVNHENAGVLLALYEMFIGGYVSSHSVRYLSQFSHLLEMKAEYFIPMLENFGWYYAPAESEAKFWKAYRIFYKDFQDALEKEAMEKHKPERSE